MRLTVPALALLATLVGCSTATTIGNAPAVSTTADPSIDFARYRTYVLLPGQLAADPAVVKITNDELDRRMTAALPSRLAAKGLRAPAGDAAPDLYVTYVAVVRQDAEIVHGGGRPGPGGYDEPGAIAPGAEWGVREFQEGSLVLLFTDAQTNAVVWKATVAAEVAAGGRTLERALDAALTRYPPRK